MDNDILIGDKGNDLFFIQGGLNIANGGNGTDTAIFDGVADAFSVFGFGGMAIISRVGDPSERTIVQSIEKLEFDDQLLAFERGLLKPVEPAAPALVASVQLDDLVIAGEVA